MPDPRLFVDIQTIQSLRDADRGIPRFATELSRALLTTGAPVAGLGLNPLVPWPRRIHPDLECAPELTWNTATAFRRALAGGPFAYIVVSPFELSRPVQAVLAAHVVGVPRVAVVHDVIPHLFADLFAVHDRDSDFARVYMQRVDTIRSFDLVLTPSESTRRDVVERWGIPPERTAVTGEAASPFFVPPHSGDDPAAFLRDELPSLNRQFVLCVSGREPHKNTESLIEAWARLGPEVRGSHQLVITCRLTDDDRRAWREHAGRLGIGADEIVMTGFVEDSVLRALYQVASLFVLPSLYEGFGLPVLEAISCGCPAITSNTSSLPEVLEWPDATFPPTDPDEIARLIERALTDLSYRAELALRCRGAVERHTWPRVVDRVLSACARFAEQPPTQAPRLRIALVGPFPPARSWSAGHNAQFAEHLAALCDVDCFTEPYDARRVGPRRRPYRMFPAAAFGPAFAPATYDLVLYMIGPTPDAAYRLASTYPGVVWLQDLGLADREMVTNARGVIVGSESSRLLLERDLGPDAVGTPTWVLPAAASDASAGPARDADEGPSSFDEVARRVVEIAELDLEPPLVPPSSAAVSAPVS